MSEEIAQFRNLWKGGYCEGDPLDPAACSSYGDMGYISILHAVYQVCVRPFIRPGVAVLEIGPGRGAWTRTMLDAREIWCLDALPAEHNAFWEYVGRDQKSKIRYFQVADFLCKDLPDDHFDFLFSFGVFCHITRQGQEAYFKHLFPKARRGANAMIMIGDFNKYNAAVRNLSGSRLVRLSRQGIVRSVRFNGRRAISRMRGRLEQNPNDASLAPGKFHHAGIADTCRFLQSAGWEIVNPDVGLVPRDPIIHFRKP